MPGTLLVDPCLLSGRCNTDIAEREELPPKSRDQTCGAVVKVSAALSPSDLSDFFGRKRVLYLTTLHHPQHLAEGLLEHVSEEA
jgi:hypothetical protein